MSENKQVAKVKPADAVRNSLQKMEGQFKLALPNHIPVSKFLRVAQTAVASNPSLLNADRTSLFSACMKAAQDGLLPDGKESALVPYGKNVQYQPMTAGILKKVRNSGELHSITAQIIHEKDPFEFWVDEDGEHLNHRPNLLTDRGKAIGTYALAKTKDGGVYIEVMTLEQIEAVKKVGAKKGPWGGDFEHEMWKKTVIRRLSKRLPMSTDLEMTIHGDDENYDFNEEAERPSVEIPQEEVQEKASKPSRLEAMMDLGDDEEEGQTVDVESTQVNEPEDNSEVPI